MKLTKEQVEKYIKAADLNLGIACTEVWVEECRKILRAAADDTPKYCEHSGIRIDD